MFDIDTEIDVSETRNNNEIINRIANQSDYGFTAQSNDESDDDEPEFTDEPEFVNDDDEITDSYHPHAFKGLHPNHRSHALSRLAYQHDNRGLGCFA